MLKQIESNLLKRAEESVGSQESEEAEAAEEPMASAEELAESPEELVEAELAEESPTEIAEQIEALEGSIPEAQIVENELTAVQEQQPIEEARPDSFARKAARGAWGAIKLGTKIVSWVPLRISAKLFNTALRPRKESSWYWRYYKGDMVPDSWLGHITDEGGFSEKMEDDE